MGAGDSVGIVVRFGRRVRRLQLQNRQRPQERQATSRGAHAGVYQHQHARGVQVPQRVPAGKGDGGEGDGAQTGRVFRGSLFLQQTSGGDPGGHDHPGGVRCGHGTDGGPTEGRTRVVPEHAGAADGGGIDAGHERRGVEPERGDGVGDRALRHGPVHHARRRDGRVRGGSRVPRAARERQFDQVGLPRVPVLGV